MVIVNKKIKTYLYYLIYTECTFHRHSLSNRSDEGLTLETSAFLPFTVANLRFQPSC